jgi:hypothetical protein
MFLTGGDPKRENQDSLFKCLNRLNQAISNQKAGFSNDRISN